ncbi:MAG TPA: HipA family kinase [Puia sp.]|nr:HipA family kinase [Puia sp.]
MKLVNILYIYSSSSTPLHLLPVYHAYSFQSVFRKGGRTQPWLVLVNEGTKLVPYVVKMFTPYFIETFDSLTNEVLGNVLAQQFDLPVPQAALIIMDENFEMTINDMQALNELPLKDERIKFGTRLITSAIEFQKGAFTSSDIKSITEIDTVFAFDFLIQNRDRNNGKPNFLISNRTGYLIDHEKGFTIETNTASKLLVNPFSQGLLNYHIFYDFLYSSVAKTKEQYFDTFVEYLKNLNPNILDSYFSQLAMYGFSSSRYKILKDYLLEMKSNWSKFGKTMQIIIS